MCAEASGGARAKPGSQAAPGSYGPSDAGPSPLLGAAVPVQGPGPGQCGPSAPRGHPPHHACARYFNHRHVVCLRRRGLFTATRATRLHPAAEPSQRPALARPGRSGLVHLLLRIFHLISPGREPRRRARRPRGPRAHRSVTAQGASREGHPCAHRDPPSPLLPGEPRPLSVLLGTTVRCCCGLATPDAVACGPPLGPGTCRVFLDLPCPALGGGWHRSPAACTGAAGGLGCPAVGVPRQGLGTCQPRHPSTWKEMSVRARPRRCLDLFQVTWSFKLR